MGIEKRWTSRLLTATCLLTLTTTASAHAAFGDSGASISLSVLNGLAHPFVVGQHLLALLAMGLALGRQKSLNYERAWAASLIALFIGIVLAQALPEKGAMMAMLGLAVVCSMAVIVGGPEHRTFWWSLICLVPLLVGLDSPPAPAEPLRHDLASRFGTWLGGGAILFYLSMLAKAAKRPWQVIGIRIGASWIAAISLLVLALQLAAPK